MQLSEVSKKEPLGPPPGGGPGTPENAKVIAGNCQRLLAVVDNSTFKPTVILTKSWSTQLLLFGGFDKNIIFYVKSVLSGKP